MGGNNAVPTGRSAMVWKPNIAEEKASDFGCFRLCSLQNPGPLNTPTRKPFLEQINYIYWCIKRDKYF